MCHMTFNFLTAAGVTGLVSMVSPGSRMLLTPSQFGRVHANCLMTDAYMFFVMVHLNPNAQPDSQSSVWSTLLATALKLAQQTAVLMPGSQSHDALKEPCLEGVDLHMDDVN